MNKTILKIIIVVVIAAGAGFYGGMKYGQSTTAPTSANQRFQANGFNITGGNGNTTGRNSRGIGQNGNFAGGEIIAKDSTSITIKLQDGSSKIVLLSETTTINKATEGTKDDLKVGEQVVVFGSENSDGSVTAQNIQLNPIMRGLPTPVK